MVQNKQSNTPKVKIQPKLAKLLETVKNPEQAAEEIDLVYVNDTMPGISRRKIGKSYRYYSVSGNIIHDSKTLTRIKSLGVPPAYQQVWICPLENGHLQATAIDARGRKQYRYHPRWRKFRSQINHLRMLQFGAALPTIRKKIERDLNQPDQTKTKILATIVKLMDLTTIRVGNQEYAKENASYGLTTMREKHVKVNNNKIRFEFKGKSNKKHTIEINNKKLARIIQNCVDMPGYELFQYFDEDGQRHQVTSSDVNEYLRQISGEEFTAKDFRTWWGTVLAMTNLCTLIALETQKERKKAVIETVKKVSQKLGNTPSVCKKYYIYPGVVDKYLSGGLSFQQQVRAEESESDLSLEEQAVLDFLKKEAQIMITSSMTV
ncbi:MAG: DNA topoisomerase IB [Patescibacteria group bacterium]